MFSTVAPLRVRPPSGRAADLGRPGIGGLIQVTVPRTATSAVSLTTCLTLNTEATGPKCSLTTAETNTAAFSTLASKAEKPCTVTNQRFVGATADGSHYFEYACSDSSGFMLKADLSAAYKGQTSCLQATSLAGGCTLTNAAAAIAEIQTRLGAAIRTAGATCSVDRFGEFAPREDSDFKATEVTCKDRPESLVVLQTDAKTSVLNCARARAEGWSCGMSQSALAWPALSNDLARATGVQKNYSDCEVNGSSGSYSLRSVYVEVTCKDGAPGFMIQYPRGESKPSEIYTCGQAVGIGGGCKMAANQPK